MKKIAILLLVPFCFFGCTEKPKTIVFTTLKQTEFYAKPFQLPGGKLPDSLRRAHDSCMGFTFDVNAMLMQTGDSFAIGSIINRQSLKVVNTLTGTGLSLKQMTSYFTVISNPCYEKRVLPLPLRSLLGDSFALTLPGANTALNQEIQDAILASQDADMQTGSWVYLDMRGALQSILDTTQSAAGLQYKKNLLDTANMVVAAVESVTDVSFLIHTQKTMSAPLLALLKSKPSEVNAGSRVSLQLSYIDDTQFEMTLNGFFPVVGQLMKAEVK